ncbi:MAG: CoA transferase, partial [Alphaproteobacteria bacterium]
MIEPTAPGALEGIRVIDLTRVLAGPFCAMSLGDMGADVIKVEQPGRGDDTRAWGPPFVGEESAYYLGVNRNKRGITLNLKEPAARAVLAELLSDADVVIDNFKLGTLARFGFDDAWFEENAPQIVRAS